MAKRFRQGDLVIYRVTKHSTNPGRRAKAIEPARCGDSYRYEVDKFWIVDESRQGEVILRTRRGKRHVRDVQDRNLRHAHWWEKLIYRGKFPGMQLSGG